LFDFIVSGFEKFVSGIPVLAIKLVEKAAVLDGENLVGKRSCPGLSSSRN